MPQYNTKAQLLATREGDNARQGIEHDLGSNIQGGRQGVDSAGMPSAGMHHLAGRPQGIPTRAVYSKSHQLLWPRACTRVCATMA